MTPEQQLISVLRIMVDDDKRKHKLKKQMDTEIGMQRYELAHKQHALVSKFHDNRQAMIKLIPLIKDTNYANEMYIGAFWDHENSLHKTYQKLKELKYEKTFHATFCPLIDEVEFQAGKVTVDSADA